METSTRKRFLFSESQGVERTQIFFEFDLNEHSVLAALLIDCKNFCGNWSHSRHFLRLTSPEMRSVFNASDTEKHHGRR
jgi:hypothetical protein